jgi:hypothetical protein
MVTHASEAPALAGQHTLGFLASLGLLSLLSERYPEAVRLSFTATRGTAVIHSPLPTLDAIAQELADIVAATVKDAVIAGAAPEFPLRAGTGPDPMRQSRGSYRKLAADLTRIDPQATGRWLPRLFTDLAVDNSGRAGLTPFAAPRAKQNVRTFFGKSHDLVRSQPKLIHEALAGWRRVEGVTGEYLDHRVLNSPVDDPRGAKAAERGVPGATWLATMALPLLRLTGDGQYAKATLWHHVGQKHVMIWPLWHRPLDPHAVQALLEHPSLKPVDPAPTVSSADWPTLGIFAVHAAERERLPDTDKFAGVLAPLKVRLMPLQ